MLKRTHNQFGIISPVLLLLVVVVGVITYLVIASAFPLKDRLLGMLFQKGSSYAAGIVDLELVPNNPSVSVNQTFLVDVVIHAKTDQPTAAQFALKYDPTVLEATKFTTGYYFNKDDTFGPPQINNTTGEIVALLSQGPLPEGCMLSAPDTCYFNYKSGTGTIATIEFKALKATAPSSAIQFDTTNSRTQIGSLNKTGDQLGTVTNSTVTVAATPTVTQTATYSLSPATASPTTTAEFPVQIRAKSDVDAANLFTPNLSFDPALLEVSRIDTTGSFITSWYSDTVPYDNVNGKVSLVGGVPNPGYTSPSSGAVMATVYFKAKATGTSEIRFDGSSAIYRNSDNANILASAASASVNANIAPATTPTPAPTSQPSATASPTAVPTASPTPTACTITGASWVAVSNPIAARNLVNLKVTASGDCSNDRVNFDIFEDDGILGRDNVSNRPPSPMKFNSNNEALSSWLTEFQQDGLLGVNNPPEYYFTAQLVGSSTTVQSSNPLLTVTEAGQGGPVNMQGDLNKNGALDWGDLSVLLSNWNKSQDFLDELDLNEDNVVNAFDASIIVTLIKAANPN